MKKEYVYVLKEEYIETNNENIRLTAENLELNLELQRKDNNWNELKEYLKAHSNIDYNCSDNIVHEQLAFNTIYEYLKELENAKNN